MAYSREPYAIALRFGYDSTWPSLISKPSATGLVTLLAFLEQMLFNPGHIPRP